MITIRIAALFALTSAANVRGIGKSSTHASVDEVSLLSRSPFGHLGQSSLPHKVMLAQTSAGLTTTILISVGVFIVGLSLGGAAAFFYMRPKKESEQPDEESKTGEGTLPTTVPTTTQESPSNLDAYNSLARKLMQRGAQVWGPKLAKGGEVNRILQSKLTSLQEKARALVVNELNDTAGSIAKALETEESMLLLDWDAAVAANFPPASVLMAGLLVPMTLATSKVCHNTMLFLVLLPVLILTVVAEIVDWSHPCYSIPGLTWWRRFSWSIALLIIIGRVAMLVKVKRAEAELREKAAEMNARISKAEEGASISQLRQLFVARSTMLQHAVVCESRVRACFWQYLVGAGTLLWLFSTFWTLWLFCRYMFVPGVVAFHPAASGHESYCAAWVSVCAVKISMILSLTFFFVNMMTVVCFLVDISPEIQSIATVLLKKSKKIDDSMHGIPVAQLLVKAFFLRGTSDVLGAKFAVAVQEKNSLTKEYEDMEKRLAALKQQIASKEEQMDEMKQQISEIGGDSLEAQEEFLSKRSFDPDFLKHKGEEAIEEAKAQAVIVEQKTTEEIEKLIEKITALMSQVQESEQFKAAVSMGAESLDYAKSASEQAVAQIQEMEIGKTAMELGEQTLEKAKLAAAQLGENERVKEALQTAEATLEAAAKAAQEAETQIKESEQYKAVVAKASGEGTTESKESE